MVSNPKTSVAQAIGETLPGEDLATAGGKTALEAPPVGEARYELLSEIGRGGMGRVVEARDRQFGRVVAVKELHDRARGATGDGSRRFLVEALITGNLEHPGVPTVYERGLQADGSPYYAMRRVHGRTLAEAIEAASGVAERLKLLPVVIRAAQAIAFVHDRGVIHRDLKPHNIIVGAYGETVVLDWGIAKVRGLPFASVDEHASETGVATSVDTAHGSVLGTPAYMAPEQAAGKIDLIDERTDVFALGALLYHVLSGAAPYSGGSVSRTLELATACEIEPLERVAKLVPRPLANVCHKALAKDPVERFQSAKELAAALETAMADAVSSQGHHRAVGWFANMVTLASLIALLGLTVFVYQVSSLHEQGPVALVYVGLSVLGSLLSLVEWRTHGKYSLGSLSLAFALATLFVGLSVFAIGASSVMTAIAKLSADAERYRYFLALGVRECAGCLSATGTMAAAQLVLWGLARRATQVRGAKK